MRDVFIFGEAAEDVRVKVELGEVVVEDYAFSWKTTDARPAF